MKRNIVRIIACICALIMLVGCTPEPSNSQTETTDKTQAEIKADSDMKEELSKLFESKEKIFTETATCINKKTASQTTFKLEDGELVINDSIKANEKDTKLSSEEKKKIKDCLKTMEKFFNKNKMERSFSITKHGYGMISFSFSDNYDADDCNEIDYNILYITDKKTLPTHLDCTKIKNKWYTTIIKVKAEQTTAS